MAAQSIEWQVISKLITCEDRKIQDELAEFDPSFYSVFKDHITWILDFRDKYDDYPDVFTFFTHFSDLDQSVLVDVNVPIKYLRDEMIENKKTIVLREVFNTIKDLGDGQIDEAWKMIEMELDKVSMFDTTSHIVDLIHDSIERSNEILEYSKQKRIPTGFPEVDKAMYGGLSTVEELVIVVARTGNGKSWTGVRFAETAQKNGFSVLYYSPEMQSSSLGARFDTWRGNFENSRLIRGEYTSQYYEYLKKLKDESASIMVVEDSNAPNEEVTVSYLKKLVRKNNIKELIIDGLSYMVDERGRRGDPDHIKYKNICSDLFKLSKQCGCAVVIMMQANRETNNNKDDKGDPFPNIYNIEGSDHPARIATQVFALRQIFDKHILELRLEKSRSANNQKPCFSYSWDINTGNTKYIPEGSADGGNTVTPIINPGFAVNQGVQVPVKPQTQTIDDESEGDDDIVEF